MSNHKIKHQLNIRIFLGHDNPLEWKKISVMIDEIKK
jgi:hypothetical protein